MKKTIERTLAALLALTALAGCRNTEQEVPDAGSLKTVRFHAGTADTRTAFAEASGGVYRTLWTENDSDVLLSLNYGKAEASAITPSADGATASFEASFNASAATAPYTFYAVSPASAARAISPSRNAWSVSIAAEQTPSALSVDEAAQLLVAKSAASATIPEEVDLHFSHLTAYGRISLRNLSLGDASVRKVELVFSTPVVGEWYWGEDGTLTSNGASHTITLNTDASGDLWFACAPVDVSGQTMRLTVYSSQGAFTKEITFPEGRKFTSGKVARFSVDMEGLGVDDSAFYLVTDLSALEEGCHVLFLNQARTSALGAQNGNYREAVTTGFSVTDDRVVLADDSPVTVFTMEVGQTRGYWSFKEAGGYLATVNQDKNYVQLLAEKNGNASWTISFDKDGSANVVAKSGVRKMLRYNPTDPRFTCYRSGQEMPRLYRKGHGSPVQDDPFCTRSEYGLYLGGTERTYVKGADQMARSYVDGRLEFVLLNASTKEQLVISGYDPSLRKGGQARVSVRYRKGFNLLVDQEYTLTVVQEAGPKVWLGDGSGQGIILKK